MSKPIDTPAPAERITLDDVKTRAEGVRDLVVNEAKQTTDEVLHSDPVRTLIIAAGIVVVAASFAFMLGARTASARMPIDPL